MYIFWDYTNSVFIIQYLCFCFFRVSSKDRGTNYLHFPTAAPQSMSPAHRTGKATLDFSLCSICVASASSTRDVMPTARPRKRSCTPLSLSTPLHTHLHPCRTLLIHKRYFNWFWRIKTDGLCFAPDKHQLYQKVTHAVTHIALEGKEEEEVEGEDSNLYLPAHISALTVQVSVEIIMHMQSADRYDAWLQKWHSLCTEPSGPEWGLGDCFLFSLLLQAYWF